MPDLLVKGKRRELAGRVVERLQRHRTIVPCGRRRGESSENWRRMPQMALGHHVPATHCRSLGAIRIQQQTRRPSATAGPIAGSVPHGLQVTEDKSSTTSASGSTQQVFERCLHRHMGAHKTGVPPRMVVSLWKSNRAESISCLHCDDTGRPRASGTANRLCVLDIFAGRGENPPTCPLLLFDVSEDCIQIVIEASRVRIAHPANLFDNWVTDRIIHGRGSKSCLGVQMMGVLKP